jgi:hypothetical protein
MDNNQRRPPIRTEDIRTLLTAVDAAVLSPIKLPGYSQLAAAVGHEYALPKQVRCTECKAVVDPAKLIYGEFCSEVCRCKAHGEPCPEPDEVWVPNARYTVSAWADENQASSSTIKMSYSEWVAWKISQEKPKKSKNTHFLK